MLISVDWRLFLELFGCIKEIETIPWLVGCYLLGFICYWVGMNLYDQNEFDTVVLESES